jgi:aminoglycoside phosphotransferase (APT) family kinase protein
MNDALPRDPTLPHLATALDGEAMARVFEGLLARPVEGCRIDRVKYRPRRNASVSYFIALRDAEGRAFEQAVATRWCQGGEAARRHTQALQRQLHPSAAGPSWSHQPKLDLCAAWAPNDAKLDALAELLDAERLCTRWLPEVMAAAVGSSARWPLHNTTLVQIVQIVRWVPEHRVCARVEVPLDDGSVIVLYAKADTEHPVAATHAALQALRANPRLSTPRPIVCQAAAGLYWQEAVQGRPLAALGCAFGLPQAAEVGEVMAALHTTPLSGARRITVEGMRQQRHEAARMLAVVEPSWQPTLGRLTAALDRGDAAMRALTPCTLHGDLHRGNLLATTTGLAMIDFDSVQRGPAVLELGSWIADSIYLALLEGQAPEASTPQWRELLRAYTAAGGAPADEAHLAWATAHQLLCQRAYRCVANLKPGRFALVPGLLRHAESIAQARAADAAPLPHAA